MGGHKPRWRQLRPCRGGGVATLCIVIVVIVVAIQRGIVGAETPKRRCGWPPQFCDEPGEPRHERALLGFGACNLVFTRATLSKFGLAVATRPRWRPNMAVCILFLIADMARRFLLIADTARSAVGGT